MFPTLRFAGLATIFLTVSSAAVVHCDPASAQTASQLESEAAIIRSNDRVAWLGATLVEQMQRGDALETALTLRLAADGVTFRNVGWSGDDASGRARAVFGGGEEGYQRRLKDLAAAAPKVVIVAYGMNEAFDASLAIETFESQMNRLLDDIAARKIRTIIALPPRIENSGQWQAAAQRYETRLKEIQASLTRIADARKLRTFSLPNISETMTDVGFQLSDEGYQKFAAELVRTLIPAADIQTTPATIALDARAEVSEVADWMKFRRVSVDGGFAWEESTSRLPDAVVSLNEPTARKVIVNNIPASSSDIYVLTIDGREMGEGTADQWQAGVEISAIGSDLQRQKMTELINRKNELFFHHYRPQNETYLFLFRKHEQGNNAVEIDQFLPLIDELEGQIRSLVQPMTHRWELRQK